MTTWTKEVVLAELRAWVDPSEWGIRACCKRAFGAHAAAVIRAYVAGVGGGLHWVEPGSAVNDGSLQAMADALNKAGVPAPGPAPLTLDELIEALRDAMPYGRIGERFNALFGISTHLRDRVSIAYCEATVSGKNVEFDGSIRGVCESELRAVLAAVNEAGWRPPAKAEAPLTSAPPATTESTKVDPYERARIQRLDTAGRPCPPSTSLAEATERARQRLADTMAALAAAERDAAIDRREIAELKAALAECGEKVPS